MEAREDGKSYYLKANWGLGRAPRGSVSVPTFFPMIMVHVKPLKQAKYCLVY